MNYFVNKSGDPIDRRGTNEPFFTAADIQRAFSDLMVIRSVVNERVPGSVIACTERNRAQICGQTLMSEGIQFSH